MARKIQVEACAKINLSLDVTGKRPDGYHDVRMVMQMIDLCDSVTVQVDEASCRSIVLDPGHADLPADRGNIAYRAAELFLEEAGISAKVTIRIIKRIPFAAGLAGGSTDAAAVLLGLEHLFKTGRSVEELMRLGVQLGADVPFCVMGNAAVNGLHSSAEISTCALAEGIGDVLTPILDPAGGGRLSTLDRLWIVLSKPPVAVPTEKIYKALDLSAVALHPDTGLLVRGLLENDMKKVAENISNVLENVTCKEYPIVVYTKNMLVTTKPIAVLMSGSGPTVFALYPDKSSAFKAYSELVKINPETYLARTK